MQIKGNEGLEELIQIMATCPEFSEIQLRVNEKKSLSLLNNAKDRKSIRFPLPTRITTKELKVSCLIQALFGCLQVLETSLKQDMLQISWIGQRISNGLVQYLCQHPHYKAILSAVTLAKCFHCRLWEVSPYVSRQLKGIGIALSTMLVASNKTTFQSILNSNPRDLESIVNRPPPMGDNLIEAVSHLPQYELDLETENSESVVNLRVHISISNHELVEEENTAGLNHRLMLIVGDSNNKCLFTERLSDERLLREEGSRWTIEIKDESNITDVYVDLISEQWVGLDVHASLSVNESKKSQLQENTSHEAKITHPSTKGLRSKSDSTHKKNPRHSIVQQIKEMYKNRLGITPKSKLEKFSFTPRRKIDHIRDNGNEMNHTVYPNITHSSSQVKPNSETLSHNIGLKNSLRNESSDEQSHLHIDHVADISSYDSCTATENVDSFIHPQFLGKENVLPSDSLSIGIPSENINDSCLAMHGFGEHFRSKGRDTIGNGTHMHKNEDYLCNKISKENSQQHTELWNKNSDLVHGIQADRYTPDYTSVIIDRKSVV